MQHIAGRYQLIEHMHHLSEADYYAALDTETQRRVTVRTIDVSKLGAVGIGLEDFAPEKLRRKMENEQRLLDRLNCPGLLSILDQGFDDPIFYVVYPAFPFANLAALEKPLPVADALRTLQTVAETLACLHNAEIVHSDISPDTILLIEDHPIVAEFSIANHDQVEGVAPGNPMYMSPEAIMGARPAPARDAWAFGVMMAYLLTGELPFGDLEEPRQEGVPRLFQKILQEPHKPLTDFAPVTTDIVALVDALLVKDAGNRLCDMRVIATKIVSIRADLLQ